MLALVRGQVNAADVVDAYGRKRYKTTATDECMVNSRIWIPITARYVVEVGSDWEVMDSKSSRIDFRWLKGVLQCLWRVSKPTGGSGRQ